MNTNKSRLRNIVNIFIRLSVKQGVLRTTTLKFFMIILYFMLILILLNNWNNSLHKLELWHHLVYLVIITAISKNNRQIMIDIMDVPKELQAIVSNWFEKENKSI